MKNLLQKSLKQLTIFSFIVFALSIPFYFLLVDWIWLKELDENNLLIAQRIENEFNHQKISDKKLAEGIIFWNEIQPVSKILPLDKSLTKDSLYTIRRLNPYTKAEEDRFRVLKTTITINKHLYTLSVETNVEETEETVTYIALITFVFFLILVIGFWILNKRSQQKLWQPFQDTLQKLKSFQLNSDKSIVFQETDTTEFVELNKTLDKLLQHSIKTYNSQKEFTENASHELQTPLAILKNKLDILLQSDDLTEKQYHIAEEMNRALMRSSRINKNLLLLTKIENSQFDNTELVSFDDLVIQSMEGLEQHLTEKHLQLAYHVESNITISGNSGLLEVLINNLLINAIRYTLPYGEINVSLSEISFEVRNSGNQALDTALLFKRFSKLSTTHNGSGLGLYIAMEISKLHGWNLQYSFENDTHIFRITF